MISEHSDDFLNFEELDNEIQNLIDQSEYQNNLKIQIEEIEILQSMYYHNKEFIIDDKILAVADYYLKGKSSELPPTIDFIINVIAENLPLEIQVVLPKHYPTVEPKIFVRSPRLTSNQIITLNSDVKAFLKSVDRGTICVLESVLWIINNIQSYREVNVRTMETESINDKLFSRFWIYSHHIYSKEKRKFILSKAKEYNITGFCLSGKPGIICGEGWEIDCIEWWQQIKSLTWKKINCIKMEKKMISVNVLSSNREFHGFSEIGFQRSKSNKTDTHTDMGEFYKYLLTHNCGYIFKNYFGFEGKADGTSLD